MKTAKALITLVITALLLLALPGCQPQPTAGGRGSGSAASSADISTEPTEESVESKSTDHDNRLSNKWGPSLVETEDALILLPMVVPNLYYYDKATGDCGPLCGRPECTHTDAGCNSYVGGASSMSCYDGKLYWLGSRKIAEKQYFGIWKMDTDGTNLELFADFQGLQDEWGVTEGMVLHRGRIYLLVREDTVEDTVPVVCLRLLSAELAHPTSFHVLLERRSSTGFHHDLNLVGDNAYFCIASIEETNVNLLTREIVRISIPAEETQQLYYAEHTPLSYMAFYVTKEEKVYLCTAEYDRIPFYFCKLWRVENGDLVPVFEFSDEELLYGHVSITDGLVRYVALDSEEELAVWYTDLEGNTLYKGPLESDKYALGVGGGTTIEFGGQDTVFYVYRESAKANKFYLLRYDVAPSGVTETVLISADLG